jgi:hypothetical protein
VNNKYLEINEDLINKDHILKIYPHKVDPNECYIKMTDGSIYKCSKKEVEKILK